jgi:GT2 family glycosyltransferase
MKVSIVLLNYGYREFAFECLRSIERMQKRDQCELIFVDNGSTESEWNRIQERLVAERFQIDKRIRLNPNQGFPGGMNAGAEVAEGEWVVMLNNDTIVGERFLDQIFAADSSVNPSTIGFLAIPICNWRYSPSESVLTDEWQADVAALTMYLSCMPVRYAELAPPFVLGPPGPVVIISALLIRRLMETYGCVYDPHFITYGEDVDLFLRARRLGFETRFVPGAAQRGEVIWHIGSATNGEDAPTMHTIGKEPAVVRRILDGMYDNVVSHAGWLELAPLLLAQGLFRLIFYSVYAHEKSLGSLWQLLKTRRDRRPPQAVRRLPRPFGFWLMKYVAVGRRKPLPWARRTAEDAA